MLRWARTQQFQMARNTRQPCPPDAWSDARHVAGAEHGEAGDLGSASDPIMLQQEVSHPIQLQNY